MADPTDTPFRVLAKRHQDDAAAVMLAAILNHNRAAVRRATELGVLGIPYMIEEQDGEIVVRELPFSEMVVTA